MHLENFFHHTINLHQKSFKSITNNHSLSQSQQQTEATDIQEDETKMNISLPYVKGTSKKTTAYTQISRNKIYFLHWKQFA